MLIRNPNEFDKIKIGLSSPERIRFWSHGEVKKPETINYRTFRPERNGLFCERIFGPVKDWECSCGKYRRVRYRGIVCERCGVEVTHSKVRRERMGHIELATPCTHIWYLKGVPSYIGQMLGMQYKQLEKIIYYDAYIVTEVDDSIKDIEVQQILSEGEYLDVKLKYGEKVKADMGASAIKDILQGIDIESQIKNLRKDLVKSTGQKYIKFTKRVRVAEAFRDSGNKPEWMVLDCIPVMPPDLRPMVQLEGGRFATSDLNDLYRRVVNRNNRLKRLMDIGAPNMIIRNEKRMLQEAVDVLFDNGKRGRAVTGTNGRPLKSIADIIEGKQGRFRQNLLGKRVDYSGRSVIVVGPSLKLHQCGLPKEMAIELFKPFIIRELVKNGHVQNVKSAKRKIENKDVIVFDVLDDVIKGHPVMLNRAPTLHRLGIQAFEPILVEGKAIQLHPLVCTAFNADFDGDQMAVHVPLSLEAQAECQMLMLASNNILSPSNGKPIITPTQDMILGLYTMTVDDNSASQGKNMVFSGPDEAIKAYQLGIISLQSPIVVRIEGERIDTTVGRVIFNNTVSDVISQFGREKHKFINEAIGKTRLSNTISKWFKIYGSTITARLCDEIKDLGYAYATKVGVSITIDDLVVPNKKKAIIEKAEKEDSKIGKQLDSKSISQREWRESILDLWRRTTADVTANMIETFGKLNNINIMANSGARGNMDQVRQLSGMRGLMADATGRTVEIPIKTNFREGLTLTDYFISAYGARKGLVDTALRTADSGYLTRRLVDIAQAVMVTEEDCGTKGSMTITAIKEGFSKLLSLEDRIVGRNIAEKIVDPVSGKMIIDKGEMITEEIVNDIADTGIEEINVRSVLACEAEQGVCQKCYGRDLSTGNTVNIGEAVGIIAAQSIGEPGTQLTMRTFHTGGVDLTKSAKVSLKVSYEGVMKYDETVKTQKTENESGESVTIVVRDCKLILKRAKGNDRVYTLPAGSTLLVKEGQKVKSGTIIAAHNPMFEYVICVNEGVVEYVGLDARTKKDKEGKEEIIASKDGEIFIHNKKVLTEYEVAEDAELFVEIGDRIRNDEEVALGVVTESSGRVIDIKDDGSKKKVVIAPGENYPIIAGARLMVKDGDKIKVDDIICRESATSMGGARDIVAGLPKVEELFEARKPKKVALLTNIDGVVSISEKEGMRKITITHGKKKEEHEVPFGVRLTVFPGKHVIKGDQLTEGEINPHDVISIMGVYDAQRFLTNAVLGVYLSQGVTINDKHVEVIVRQMTRKVRIREIGDSHYLFDDYVTASGYEKTNKELQAAGKKPAVGDRVLLGLTKASLNTDSMISSASFQETTSVLARSAINGKEDPMYGLKENVIIGKLIPSGTGLRDYERVKLSATEEGVDLEAVPVDLEEEVFNV